MKEKALGQLRELAESSNGAIQVLSILEKSGSLTLLVSLDTSGTLSAPSGIKLRPRERFEIVVTESFPFSPPSVFSFDRRWAGTPHVQWGRYLCLYAAAAVEWNPSDGIRGLIARLNLWLQRAAAGTLDPEGQPLHPPAAYADDSAGHAVVHADIGERAPWLSTSSATEQLFAWCRATGDRVDVDEWLSPSELMARIASGAIADQVAVQPHFVGFTLLVEGELGFEYPKDAKDLIGALGPMGFPADRMIEGITRATLVNRFITSICGASFPNLVLLATPSRSVDGYTRLAHLTAWKLDELGAKIADLMAQVDHGPAEHLKPEVVDLARDYLSFSKVRWMTIYESRSEVTVRRDQGQSTNWLTGKSVLVIGCGAIGAPMAENILRAGAKTLTVLDNKRVSPGILVRQPYADDDIGKPKAEVLAARLSRIYPDVVASPLVRDAKTLVRESTSIWDFDLIIDASADIGVRSQLEEARTSSRKRIPPIVTAVIGHLAERGVVAVSKRLASGGSTDILRRVGIQSRDGSVGGWQDVAWDLFPDVPRGDLFFPEPGCSSPTFIGSAAHVSALSSLMLVAALDFLSGRDSSAAMMARVVRIDSPTDEVSQASTLQWTNDAVLRDHTRQWEIRVSTKALNEMRAEARRGRRVRGDRVETGGMLIGAFDESTAVVHVDAASGPPPDSRLSSMYFDHGIRGTQELIDSYAATSHGEQRFVGMWHTHPQGRASPSSTDEHGMASIVTMAGIGRRSLMLILGGDNPGWERWLDQGHLPKMYARVIDRKTATMPGTPGWVYFSNEPWFRGGYDVSETVG